MVSVTLAQCGRKGTLRDRLRQQRVVEDPPRNQDGRVEEREKLKRLQPEGSRNSLCYEAEGPSNVVSENPAQRGECRSVERIACAEGRSREKRGKRRETKESRAGIR